MIFLFFSSSLACLEPELELFEVWEINVRQIIIIANGINSQTPKLKAALARVLDEVERNQKKGKSSKYNFQDDGHISSCSIERYRKEIYQPQKLLKIADWGKNGENC